MYRCAADVEKCRAYYEDLSKVDGEILEWRRIALGTGEPKWVFFQPDLFVKDGTVVLKEYESTPRGVVKAGRRETYDFGRIVHTSPLSCTVY